jgi:hypothetical protein
MNPQEALSKCARDALLTLGEPTMQSLVWHLSNAGVQMTPDAFDVRKFYEGLQDIVGGGADIVMDIVARSMALELKLNVDFDSHASALDKVLKVLEVAQKVAH